MVYRTRLFPPVGGNSFTTLAGSACFYPDMLAAMGAAWREILLVTYLWDDDATGRAFVEAAAAAARRGVRVAVMVDGVGGREVARAGLARIRHAGGDVTVFHPVRLRVFSSRLFRRNHRKLLLVDGETAYIGGAGFADEWSAEPPREWWDVMARVHGPVVEQMRQVFLRDWRRYAGRLHVPPLPRPAPCGSEVLRALPSRLSRRDFLAELTEEVRGATRAVSIANAYFSPGLLLREALRRAAERGAEVRLLLPGPRTNHPAVRTAGRRYFHSLLQAGVRIFEWQRSSLHSKYAVVDGRWGAIGSSNLDNWSSRVNLELDLGLHSPGALAGLEALFLLDLQGCREVTLDRWLARPRLHRLAERVFGWFDPLL